VKKPHGPLAELRAIDRIHMKPNKPAEMTRLRRHIGKRHLSRARIVRKLAGTFITRGPAANLARFAANNL